MSKAKSAELAPPRRASFRDWFANSLGVRQQRKEEIYIDISKSATLLDPAYWLQILFAAGIATLGLILNSPAVIIGAMLISPLMGSILAAGLALAAGDLILGLRAVVNLALSCAVAVVFAISLVSLLPFKEMTGEIAARTEKAGEDPWGSLFLRVHCFDRKKTLFAQGHHLSCSLNRVRTLVDFVELESHLSGISCRPFRLQFRAE